MLINFKNMSGNGGNTGIGEAPIDGKQYARQDATWTEVQAGSAEQDSYTVYVPTINPFTGEINLPLIQKFKDLNKVELAKIIEADKANKAINITLRYGVEDKSGTRLSQGIAGNAYYIGAFSSGIRILYKSQANTQYEVIFDANTGDITSSNAEFTLTDAPEDGKMYARQNVDGAARNKWVEVPTSGGGSAEEPIEVVVPTFNFKTDPITVQYDIKPEDKTANIAAAEAIKVKINAGEAPNVVVRDNRKTSYFIPWKVNVFRDKVGFVAMQELYGNRKEFIGYNIEADGSVITFADWKGADERNLKTINGESIVGNGDITISGGEGGGGTAEQNTFLVFSPAINRDGSGIYRNLTPERIAHNQTVIPKLIGLIGIPAKPIVIQVANGDRNDFYNWPDIAIYKYFGGKLELEYSINNLVYHFEYDQAGNFTAFNSRKVSYTTTEIDNMIGAANNKLELI